MKTMKAIAALCAATMALSTMALPVQAKTSKAETEVITMDDDTTATKPKTKKTTTKKSKSSQVSWKNAGKPLQCTIKTERDFYKAMSNAIRLNAPSLKVTFDKSYKGRKNLRDDGLLDVYSDRYVYDLGMSEYNYIGLSQRRNADGSIITFEFSYADKYYGNAFCYAYNTGDMTNISDKYADMYEIFSEAADNCTETTDLGKAEYAWNWVVNNLVYDGRYSGAALTKTFNNPTTDGRYPAVCENYANAYILLMRMLNVPCWFVHINDDDDTVNPHGGVCAQLNGEYRYFDPTWGRVTTDTTKTNKANPYNMTAREAETYYNAEGYKPYVCMYEVDNNASEQHRELTFSELEEYFIW